MTNTKRAAWERVPGLHEISNGKNKVYRRMVRFERACKTCTEPFGIYVTEHCADNEGHNSNFGLRNCEKHRMKMVAQGVNADEVEKLRMTVSTMKAELDPLYAYNKELFAELQVAKARLALYELQPAMERAASIPADPTGQQLAREFAAKNGIGCELVQNTTDSNLTFPWRTG